MMQIKFRVVKRDKDGPFAVQYQQEDTVWQYAGYMLSRKLTRTTFEDGHGVFDPKGGPHWFSCCGEDKQFIFEPLNGRLQDAIELERRITQVRAWALQIPSSDVFTLYVPD